MKKAYLNSLKMLHFTRQSPTSQLTFTCSNSTVESLEKGVKYIQS